MVGFGGGGRSCELVPEVGENLTGKDRKSDLDTEQLTPENSLESLRHPMIVLGK